MVARWFAVGLLALASSGCRPDGGPPSSGDDWSQFEGIEYRAPAGTQRSVEDSVLPGPGGMGGRPVGELVVLTLSKARPGSFYLTIERSRGPLPLESERRVLEGNRVGRNLVGKTTANGWELTYELLDSTGTPLGIAHEIYAELAGGHYKCTWGEMNCEDRTAPDAICRSMRARAR